MNKLAIWILRQGGIVKLLSHASAETGQTIIMVTHDNRASSHVNRIVFPRDGCIEGETYLTDENKSDLKRLVELGI